MKLGHFFSFFVALLVTVASSAQSEFRCESEIRYRWKQLDKNDGKKTAEASQATPTPTTEDNKGKVAVVEGREVFWSSASASAETEEEAKNSLKAIVTDQRARADSACRDSHENQTKCVATKYSQNTSTFQVMSFSQRKAFEKKIIEDCEQAAGNCLGSAATEASCIEIKKAEVAPAAEAKGKEAKKK
jgi:hypothetical protein